MGGSCFRYETVLRWYKTLTGAVLVLPDEHRAMSTASSGTSGDRRRLHMGLMEHLNEDAPKIFHRIHQEGSRI